MLETTLCLADGQTKTIQALFLPVFPAGLAKCWVSPLQFELDDIKSMRTIKQDEALLTLIMNAEGLIE